MEDNAVLIMSAAPADYTPSEPSGIKIKKTDGELIIRLIKNPDILMNVARKRLHGELTNIFVAGFAAETTDVELYARKKLIEKNLDMICLNDVSRAGAGFGVSTNIITIFTRDGGYYPLPIMPKEDVASNIIDHIEKLLP
jgi:phosphopantothenoylcysteine decarboxylase/phosphopantothenate--cysteine ligase